MAIPGTPSIAIDTIQARSSESAWCFPCFKGWDPATRNSTRSSPSCSRANSATIRWALWIGSNDPPKIPRPSRIRSVPRRALAGGPRRRRGSRTGGLELGIGGPVQAVIAAHVPYVVEVAQVTVRRDELAERLGYHCGLWPGRDQMPEDQDRGVEGLELVVERAGLVLFLGEAVGQVLHLGCRLLRRRRRRVAAEQFLVRRQRGFA